MDKHQMLDLAVAQGIINAEQRERMEAIAASDLGDSEERLKPVGTFNEIFVTVGVALLTSAVAGLLALIIKDPVINPVVGAFVLIMVAEHFHSRKRFRLPLVYCALSAALALGTATAIGLSGNDVDVFNKDTPLIASISPLVIGLLALIAATWRYSIPFLMLPISVLFTIIITIAARATDDDMSFQVFLGASGLAILAFAVRCDLLDPTRTKRWSDYAFWSYVVGSPLFVHSLFLSILLRGDEKLIMSGLTMLAVAVLTMAVSFAGLLLNRRALILSTLAYVAFVIYRILAGLTLSSSVTVLLVTLLAIGLYVTALGSRWRQVRNRVMDSLPPWKWLEKLPVR